MKTGTREWSGSSYNISLGCSNNCHYCYAKANAARFKKCDPQMWYYEKIVKDVVLKDKLPWKKQPIMFPTAHDITPYNLEAFCHHLKYIVMNRNEVLIVSKPRILCIDQICATLDYVTYQNGISKDQIEFRFSIGSTDDEILRFWEPGAPDVRERRLCAAIVIDRGYKCSISSEPILDVNVHRLVNMAKHLGVSSIWIGLPNSLLQRLSLNKAPAPVIERAKELLESLSEEWVLKTWATYKADPIVKWKDSIKKVLR